MSKEIILNKKKQAVFVDLVFFNARVPPLKSDLVVWQFWSNVTSIVGILLLQDKYFSFFARYL